MLSLGLSPGSTVGLSAFESYKDDPKVLENMRRALAGEEIHDTLQLDGICGRLFFDTRYSPLLNETGAVAGVVGVATDITEQKRLEEELAHRANHDPLTGTPNRQLFGDRLLVAVAWRLSESLRHEDTICRLGGDEFVVLLEDMDVRAP